MSYDLRGCCDLHVHTGPDIVPRKLGGMEMARQASAAGMRGFAVKSHVGSTAGRVSILRELFPELQIFSGITLNRQVGGINPAAVEAAAKMGAKLLWFPTMDAKLYRKEAGAPDWESGLSALNGSGRVSEEALAVLHMAKKYNMVVGTGHLGGEEGQKLVEAGHKIGVRHMVLTHVTLPVCQMDVEQLRCCVSLGAVLEYFYCHILSGKCTAEYTARQIQAVGAEHVILSTDLGQLNNPDPVEGLAAFCGLLLEHGISEEELDQMTKRNPCGLLLDT